MNKDVIYIEPEDDITDIIGRIKASKQKVVALVPPKKLGIMRSAVNMKLIQKTAKTADKAVVIVTADPSLVKISAVAGLPVAKTLSSRPVLPSEFKKKKAEPEEIKEEEVEGEIEDEADSEDVEVEPKKTSATKTSKKEVLEEVELDEEEIEEDEDKKKKKSEKKENTLAKKIPNFDKYQKLFIFGGIGGVLLIIILVWALAIAPAAEILVKMKTTASSISENVSFVTDQAKVDNKAGKFLLEQIKFEDEASVEFEPTGKANKGEKATGTVSIYALYSLDLPGGSTTLPAGTKISIAGKDYVTQSANSNSWNGMSNDCHSRTASLCYKSFDVSVAATEGGTAYNIGSSSDGIISASGFSFIKSSDMTGGTDKEVTVVSESDINDAKSQLENNTEAKEKLLAQINGTEVVKIDASYKVESKDPVSSPKKNEEVEKGKKAKLTAKTIYTIYVVDRKAIDDYINNYEADKIKDNEKIYTTGSPFFERFVDAGKGNYTAKLKSTVKTGPELSESKVLEIAMGEKVGEAKARVKDISHGIKEVEVNVSFPWVYAIPNDPNKVTVKIEVEE